MVNWIFQALIQLGIGWITYTAFTAAYDYLHGYILQQWASLPGDVFQVLSLLGFGEGLGLIFSALTIRLGLLTRARFGKLTGP